MLIAQRDSLRQLWLILWAAIFVPVVLFGYTAWSGYRAAHDVADRQIVRTRDVVSEHALKVFETIDRSIALVDEIVQAIPPDELPAREPELHARLKQIVAESPQMKSLWVFGANGRSIANSLLLPSPALDFSDRDYFSSHIDTPGKDLFVGDVLRPRAPYGGVDFFGISRRRNAPDGGFAGVIQVSMLPEYFKAFYDRIGREDGAYLALLREDGVILARHPAATEVLRLDPQSPLGSALAAKSESGILTGTLRADGVIRRIAYARLPNYPVYVVAGYDTGQIRAAWTRWLGGYLLFGVPATAALVGVVLLAQHRTRRFYAEAARRQAAEAALRQAQRLEALGQLTGGVAHDFNNLLMVIGGSAQLLRKHRDGPKASRSLDMIETAVRRASALTQKLLAFARRRALAPKVIDLGVYLADFREVLVRSLRSDIVIRCEGLVPGLAVEIDPDELEVALLNLAVNARDAMPDGGDLVIELASHSFARERGPDGIGGDFVVIRVSDSGVGIDPEIRIRIFEPFFTTKAPGKGTGLGLSQVYGFAKQSGGAVEVESYPGKGTTFVLYLPRSRKSLTPVVAPVEENHAAAPGAKALLVEDNKEVAEIAGGYLTQLGYGVTHAQNVDEALRLLRDTRDFEFVLSDIVMPGGLSGLDLAQTVRAQHAGLPVILATGYSERAEAARRDGFLLLAKPYSLETLMRAIQQVLREKQSEKQSA